MQRAFLTYTSIFRIILSVVFLFVVKTDGQTSNTSNNIVFYRVTSPTATVYLYGTLHAAEDGSNQIPQYVIDALNASSYYVQEFDWNALPKDQKSQKQAMQQRLYFYSSSEPSGISMQTELEFKSYLNRPENKTLKNKVQKQFLSGLCKPFTYLAAIEQGIALNAEKDRKNGSENMLAALPSTANKIKINLESLEDYVTQYDQVPPSVINAFIRAKIAYAISPGPVEPLDMQEFAAVKSAMTTQRETKMLPKIMAFLNSQGIYFIAIGAFHLNRDGIIVTGLAKEFTVANGENAEKKIEPSATDKDDKNKEQKANKADDAKNGKSNNQPPQPPPPPPGGQSGGDNGGSGNNGGGSGGSASSIASQIKADMSANRSASSLSDAQISEFQRNNPGVSLDVQGKPSSSVSLNEAQVIDAQISGNGDTKFVTVTSTNKSSADVTLAIPVGATFTPSGAKSSAQRMIVR